MASQFRPRANFVPNELDYQVDYELALGPTVPVEVDHQVEGPSKYKPAGPK